MPQDTTDRPYLAAALALRLRTFSDEDLAALNLAIDIGRVPKHNSAYKQALREGLIRENGTSSEPDELKVACTTETLRRWSKP